MKRKLPPFGREVIKALQDGLRPRRALYVVRSWLKGDVPLWTVVVPRGDDPNDYDLSLCHEVPVWLKLPRMARDNASLITLVEAADPAGGASSPSRARARAPSSTHAGAGEVARMNAREQRYYNESVHAERPRYEADPLPKVVTERSTVTWLIEDLLEADTFAAIFGTPSPS